MPVFMSFRKNQTEPRTPHSGGRGSNGHAAATPHGAQRRLLARLRAGRQDAREAFVRGYSAMALAVARRIVRDESLARETVKDAMLNALSSVHSVPRGASLDSWLRRMVVEAAVTSITQRNQADSGNGVKIEPKIEDLLPAFDDEGHFADGAAVIARSSEGPARLRSAPRTIRECVAHLPETYRVVLMLREFGELDTAETATRLGITPVEVKTRLHRARLALVGLLSGAMGDLGLGGQSVEAS